MYRVCLVILILFFILSVSTCGRSEPGIQADSSTKQIARNTADYPALPPVRKAETVTPLPYPTRIPGKAPTAAKVKLLNGEVKDLASPLSTSGKLTGVPPCPDLELQYLALENIQKISRIADDSLELIASGKTLAMLPGSAILTGSEGDTRTSVELSEVQEITFEGAKPEEETLPRQWEIISACGQQLGLDKLKANLSEEITLHLGKFALMITLTQIQRLYRPAESPDMFELSMSSGAVLKGLTFTDDKVIQGSSVFGKISAPLKDIYLLQPQMALAQQKLPDNRRVWRISDEIGITLDVYDLVLDGGAANPLKVNRIDGNGLSALSVKNKGELALEAGDHQFVVYGGNLLGKAAEYPGIHIDIQSENIASISTSSPPLPDPDVKPTVGKLSLASGDVWEVRLLNFNDGGPEAGAYGADPTSITSSMMLDTGVVQYWVEHDWLRQHGFNQAGEKLTLPCVTDELCPAGTVEDEAEITFENYPFNMKVAIGDIQSYQPVQQYSLAPLAPLWELRLTGLAGEIKTVYTINLSFARFPSTCWTGMYSVWPFRWYKDDAVVTGSEGAEERAPLKELSRIEFDTECKTPNCNVRLVYKNGSTKTAMLFPGSLNTNTKKGPASWSHDLEGLLGQADEGILVFIPFSKVASVELIQK